MDHERSPERHLMDPASPGHGGSDPLRERARLMAALEQRDQELQQLAAEAQYAQQDAALARAEAEHAGRDAELARADARRAREEAERAHAARSQFLSSMSHELRTPLNAIAAYTELLELGIPGELNEEQRNVLARIQRNERRLLGLINDILNFTRLTGTPIEFPLEPVELAPLIAGLEPLLGPQISRRQIDFRCAPPGRGVVAVTNPERLEQILLNLLSNAMKFTAPGGWIRVSCGEHGDDCVAVVVEDSGRGIAPEQQVAIFEPFVQIDPDPARENAGVGLGLAIARELARAMHSEIDVQSLPERGSRFTVRLPAA